jgi:type I restriction enzyme, S subunit
VISESLPESWTALEIGELASLVGGGTPSRTQPEFFTGDIPWLTGADLSEDNITFVSTARDYITEGAISKSATSLVPENTILLTTRVNVGKVAIASKPLCFSQDLTGIIIDNVQVVEPVYLAYFLLAYREVLLRFNRGTTITGIRREDVYRLKMPLPPLPEQARIVDILRRADELRRLRQQTREKADKLPAAVFHDMFGDPVRAQKNWQKRLLGEFVAVESTLIDPKSSTYKQYWHIGSDNIESKTGSVINLQTIGDVGSMSGKFPFTPNNILYSKIRPALQKVATPDFDGLCSADIYPLSFDSAQVRKQFLAQLLRTNHFTAYAARVSGRAQIPKINQTDLLSYETVLPDISSQDQFEKKAQETLDYYNELTASTLYLDQLFSSLLTRAFSGELTAEYRAQHQEELRTAAVQRDIALGRRGPTARVIDFKQGRVTPEEEAQFRQSVAKVFQPAIRDILASLGTANVFETLARQINFPTFADLIRPALPAYAGLVSNILAENVASIGEVMRLSLANRVSDVMAESLTPLAESVRLPNQAFYQSLSQHILALADAQIQQAAEQEPPQPERAIHARLDRATTTILQAVQALPIYFTPAELHQLLQEYGHHFDQSRGADLVQIEASLHLLQTLGFTRQVMIDNRLVYRLVDQVADGALLPEELAE